MVSVRSIFKSALTALTAAVAVVLLVTPAANSAYTEGIVPAAERGVTQSSIRTADVDDFSFDSYHADVTLGRDADGRSALHTTERFVARFPNFDQNRGFI